MNEIFESLVRSANDYAGVFDSEDEVNYFYLYYLDSKDGNKIVDHIRVFKDLIGFNEGEVKIVWSIDEIMVALYLKNVLTFVFDVKEKNKYGENLKANDGVGIPEWIVDYFQKQ